LYDLALAVNQLPAGSRIAGLPSAGLYYLDSDRFPTISSAKVELPPAQLAGRYDFAAYKFGDDQAPSCLQAGAPLLTTPDGYTLCTVPAGVSVP
jgi:hypothetical protein